MTDCAIGSAHHKDQLVGNIAVVVLVGLGGDASFNMTALSDRSENHSRDRK